MHEDTAVVDLNHLQEQIIRYFDVAVAIFNCILWQL